ncbi:hypothetical protein MLD38_024411 [Melastoma candidum]|uniref:Uncharacterized protein n=1 Tax=Melastoma candidum TaxID=119954 RepID=A0ACB9NTI7_9MYRT|nr:hypothetical protein MLD38_024411 [Melastoma candidum]
MAVDLCSEPFDIVSPRISFSHDLPLSGNIPVEQAPLRSNSPGSNPSFDFDSCGFDRPASSSADELFLDGKMIPLLEMKKCIDHDVGQVPLPLPKKKEGEEEGEKEAAANCSNRNKSFWGGFRRSSSLNSGGSYGRMGLCPLPLLSRSNSTGSATGPRSNKHWPTRKSFPPRELPPVSNLVGYQKPPMRKPGNIGIGRNTVRVDPLLNVVGPVNLFGLRSVFSRDKRKRK